MAADEPPAWLIGSPTWRRIETLTVYTHLTRLGDWIVVMARGAAWASARQAAHQPAVRRRDEVDRRAGSRRRGEHPLAHGGSFWAGEIDTLASALDRLAPDVFTELAIRIDAPRRVTDEARQRLRSSVGPLRLPEDARDLRA